MTDMVIIGLVVSLILSNAYWMFQVQRLVNKLMCRDFAEYQRVTHEPVRKKPEPQMFHVEPVDDLSVLDNFKI